MHNGLKYYWMTAQIHTSISFYSKPKVLFGGGSVRRSIMMLSDADFNAPLRHVTMEDFQLVKKKLKASVHDKWNRAE